MNMQDVRVYVLRGDGAWLYLPKENALKMVSSDNLLGTAA